MTDTADSASTVNQVMALARAGSELVRVTVNTDEAAAAVPRIADCLDKFGVPVPIIGDFHYNGHLLLKKYPDCARALAKYRINPGNVNIGKKHDDNFRTMIEAAIEYGKPVRVDTIVISTQHADDVTQEQIRAFYRENAFLFAPASRVTPARRPPERRSPARRSAA